MTTPDRATSRQTFHTKPHTVSPVTWGFITAGAVLTFCAGVFAAPPLAIIGAACTIAAIIVGWD